MYTQCAYVVVPRIVYIIVRIGVRVDVDPLLINGNPVNRTYTGPRDSPGNYWTCTCFTYCIRRRQDLNFYLYMCIYLCPCVFKETYLSIYILLLWKSKHDVISVNVNHSFGYWKIYNHTSTCIQAYTRFKIKTTVYSTQWWIMTFL